MARRAGDGHAAVRGQRAGSCVWGRGRLVWERRNGAALACGRGGAAHASVHHGSLRRVGRGWTASREAYPGEHPVMLPNRPYTPNSYGYRCAQWSQSFLMMPIECAMHENAVAHVFFFER